MPREVASQMARELLGIAEIAVLRGDEIGFRKDWLAKRNRVRRRKRHHREMTDPGIQARELIEKV